MIFKKDVSFLKLCTQDLDFIDKKLRKMLLPLRHCFSHSVFCLEPTGISEFLLILGGKQGLSWTVR